MQRITVMTKAQNQAQRYKAGMDKAKARAANSLRH